MVKKQFEISRDHWIALQQAVDESLEAIFPALKVALMRKVELVEYEDPIVVRVEPQWFEDMKAALAAHPEPEVGEYYIRDVDTLLELAEDVYDPAPQGARGQTLAEFSLGLVLVVLAGIIFLALLGPAVNKVVGTADAPPVELPPGIEIPERLGDLPLSEHAVKEHVNQKYNVETLIPMWDQDQCRRKMIYWCPKTSEFKFFCEVEPEANGKERWGGIILGYRDQPYLQVVTAYPDSWTYWVRRIFNDGCFMVGMP
jgi:hypothetical protein